MFEMVVVMVGETKQQRERVCWQSWLQAVCRSRCCEVPIATFQRWIFGLYRAADFALLTL